MGVGMMCGKVIRTQEGKLGIFGGSFGSIKDYNVYGYTFDGKTFVTQEYELIADSVQDYIDKYVTQYMDPSEAGKLV
jgi:hypothetical protein